MLNPQEAIQELYLYIINNQSQLDYKSDQKFNVASSTWLISNQY